MAQCQQALVRHQFLPSTYTTAKQIEEARRFIRLADDVIALVNRWKFQAAHSVRNQPSSLCYFMKNVRQQPGYGGG